MKPRHLIWLALAHVCLAADPPDSREFFENRIRPVLAKNCFACHGTAAKMGGLDLGSRAAILKGGTSGPSVVPGDPDKSLLVQSVRHQSERFKMPMQQPKLAAAVIDDLAAWVKAGAAWPETPTVGKSVSGITPEQRAFWSLQPVRKPAPPKIRDESWARTPVDRFVLAALESKSLRPNAPASKRALIRRAYYDLVGLPPPADEVDAFVRDNSPDAYARLVERLLASAHYGERWGRHWLDIARYSDDRLESEVDAPYANAFRYRDWVIKAFNDDMPYDRFVKAQIAGDLVEKDTLSAGLGFYALRPDTQDDRVDVTGRAFLGLTTGCAQCHNHKFDPIPTTDFYALQGIFESSKDNETPLAPEPIVKEYTARQKAVDDKKAQIRDFLKEQAYALADMLASQTARYLRAARTGAERDGLDAETLARWVAYVNRPAKDHPYLKGWADAANFDYDAFQERVLAVLKERKAVDEQNVFSRAEAKKKGSGAQAQVVSLKTESFFLWRDLFFNDFYGNQFKQEDDGLLYYGPNRGFYESDGTVERFLEGQWKLHLKRMRAELEELKAKVPAQYPFLHTITESDKPKTMKVKVGGNSDNLGEEVPRRFLSVFSEGAPPVFAKGSGRLELAEAIASPSNPLTARVMVNRIWQHHFGAGIVRTPSDFGFMGDRPSHPELLDHLAARLVESGWSVKAVHREIMLSATYQLSAARDSRSEEADPGNRLLWRANVRRLDAEALRDSLLAAAGRLAPAAGGPPEQLASPENSRRSVYGFVSRRKMDGALALFDFPNANLTADRRSVTITPPQQLFFLNADFVARCAADVARRAEAASAQDRVGRIYRAVLGRAPSQREVQMGIDYVGGTRARWPLYAQALLNSNEFVFVD